ncbi:MAG: thiamine pyrophosphate-dependent enzyme [Asgard group archaeon]|nr:thiamine pyrophosphate-dependent enzyme [Asgard group archaeon]
MKGFEVLRHLAEELTSKDIIVSSNGNISREVYHLLPQPQIYLRGSMGLPVSVGLGLALARPDKRIIVITGDGNFLMGLGSVTTTSFYSPSNLRILILDNNKYYTTGGQKTVSSTIQFSKFLKSLKINEQFSKNAKIDEIKDDLRAFLNTERFSVLHLVIEESKLALENIPWHPEKIAEKIISKIS